LAGTPIPRQRNWLCAPEQAPRLTQALLDRGYSEADIRGILGGNFLRVAETVWK
jgi:membrane dipeptidase